MRYKDDKSVDHTFDGAVSKLGNERFDVAAATGEHVGRSAGARRVSKYGCAAEIGPGLGKDLPIEVLVKPGWVLNGEIAHILDRGYQKFLATARLQIPATAEHLRCLHRFSEEFKEAIGALSLYNQSMGTTSNVYVYDRVKGRETA